MIDYGKRRLFGVALDAVDYDAAVEKIVSAAHEGKPMRVSATAVHGLITAAMDPEQKYRLNAFDLVVPDGQPVVWALNSLYRLDLPGRVYGPKLTLQLCQRAAEEGLPVYFYGSRQLVLDSLCRHLQEQFPHLQLAGARPSLFRTTSDEEKAEIEAHLRSTGARILFVGLGCPRQEVWAYEYALALGIPVIAVGAAFDFHAGCLPQAPPWMQRHGLEWLFRLSQEPTRLWKRYLTTNPLFLALWLLQACLGGERFAYPGSPPRQPLRYG